MFRTDGADIIIPRGDSALIPFALESADSGETYFLEEGQTLELAVFPVRGAEPVIRKTAGAAEQTEEGSVIFSLAPEDTDIGVGRYLYTLRLFSADGTEADTLAGGVGKARFTVS